VSGARKYRSRGAERRKAFSSGRTQPSQPSLWQRAECCGAMIAADPDRMARDWADVHEAGCRAPWDQLGLDGLPREVYPGAGWLPEGTRLRAVNRKAGVVPARPQHAAAYRGQP
jgi:hypothetical protein